MAEPIAMPMMKDAAMMANAYVVGPMINAMRRVHATSNTRAENPESAAAVVATARCGVAAATLGGAPRFDGRVARRPEMASARAFGGADAKTRPDPFRTQSAPAAAARFSATAIQVDARAPYDGISQNPAPSAPRAAPAVLAA
jgi:hypothetical protein